MQDNNADRAILSRLSGFLSSELGLYFNEKRQGSLLRGIESAAREFGFNDDVNGCIRWLLSSPLTRRQLEVLAGYLTVSETYFFRDRECFGILEDILSGLIARRRNEGRYLRIWSAGCSTGEEPYSVAILLSRMIHDISDWNITLLATDINTRALKKASEGIYTDWSFRNTPSWVRDRYFLRMEGNRFQINDRIKGMVDFAYLNLTEDSYPRLLNSTNAMDIIICRNVFIYFLPDLTENVIKRLSDCLIDGGWLVTTPVEASQVRVSGLEIFNVREGSCFRKSRRRQKTEGVTLSNGHSAGLPAGDDISWDEERSALKADMETPACTEIEEKNETPESFYGRALELYEEGLYEEAAMELSGLLSSGEEGPLLHKTDRLMSLLSRAFANQGRLDDALAWCNRAISVNRLDPAYHYLRATILIEKAAVEDALSSLRHAIYLDPDFVLAYFLLGNISRRQGRFREAERYFENVVSILSKYKADDEIPESGGIAAGRMAEIVESLRQVI